jgi:hypothetical protein
MSPQLIIASGIRSFYTLLVFCFLGWPGSALMTTAAQTLQVRHVSSIGGGQTTSSGFRSIVTVGEYAATSSLDPTATPYCGNFGFHDASCGVVAVEEMEHMQIEIFPNPSAGVFTLTTSHSLQKSFINIYDVCGQLVHSTGIATQQQQMDLSHLPAGQYLVLVQNNREIYKRLIVVE